ncbi:MAG: hypothetical protein WA771_14380 [Chthoniobacterales bacterium]
MSDSSDSEDLLIRRLLLGGATFLILGAIATAVLIAFAISANFNFLQWME